MHRIEFTIEPFVEGRPGPHVTEAIGAVEALGVPVEIGPFGSTCAVPASRVGEVVASLSAAATAHGATHVHLDITSPDIAGAVTDEARHGPDHA